MSDNKPKTEILRDQTPAGDGRFQNVEFSMDIADRDDLEAMERSKAAGERQISDAGE
ncbi:YfhD family protein [Paenibacillus turpanensis]|uniref:YfhD family protein n=1 Tax=Paenibacillus turpanensis TaxID=2689078 RepID=UPI00140C8823|nr:YfhD family protein [Paenibacillus turpanensis]